MVKRSREAFDPPFITSDSPEVETPNTLSSTPSNADPDARESVKMIHLDVEDTEESTAAEVIRCLLPPHRQPLSFTSYEDYEIHYNKTHVNRCIECRKNFPTPRFLDLHQEENHNPLVGILKDRGERTYACFVEDCERKCSTPQKRRMHLIDKHMFPKEYNYDIVDEGIDQRNSMLRSGGRRRRSSILQQGEYSATRSRPELRTKDKSVVEMERTNEAPDGFTESSKDTIREQSVVAVNAEPDEDVDSLAGAMAALKFVPPSIRFGRGKGKGRGGFSRS